MEQRLQDFSRANAWERPDPPWRRNAKTEANADFDAEWESTQSRRLCAGDHGSSPHPTLGSSRSPPLASLAPLAVEVSPFPLRSEMSQAELEALRLRRREKRRREKERKRLEREEKQRRERVAPKTSKINVVSGPYAYGDLLARAGVVTAASGQRQESQDPKGTGEKVEMAQVDRENHENEEYPELGSKPRVREDTPKTLLRGTSSAMNKERPVEEAPKEESSKNSSYSGALKSSKETVVQVIPEEMESLPKKVKKKDPITIDLFSALKINSSQSTDSKVNQAAPSYKNVQIMVPNKLDSTAPRERRGKEREVPKKKRLTAMKQSIISARKARGISKSEVSDEKYTQVSVEKIGDDLMNPKEKMHSKRFRGYCTHTLSKELDTHIRNLITDLIRFQDRQFAKDATKAKAKRRYTVGMREVLKFLKVHKIQLLIMAPDLENSGGDQGLDKMVEDMLNLAKSNGVPVAFGLTRRGLGKACVRKVPVSCVGIMNSQGSDEHYRKILGMLPDLQETYNAKYGILLQKSNETCLSDEIY